MDILTDPGSMRAWRARHPQAVGLVPTMGFLHAGHMALVERACAENAVAVTSVFVNPIQFGPNDDFARYPRDEARDLGMLREAGVAAVYLPTPAVIYPPGYQTHVEVGEVSRPLEGAARPGHFRGVATVVLKLLHAVGPDRAYFGRKDAQQLRVIRRMCLDLDLGIEIVACDIVREPDGLAMSSRNVYLDPGQRAAAPVVHRALRAAGGRWAAGERDADRLRAVVHDILRSQPLAVAEYVSLADEATLEELHGSVTAPAVLSTVVRFGAIRLLDNIELG